MTPLLAQAAQAARYVHYLLTSGSAHGLHSPFVYDLYTNVIRHSGRFLAYAAIEDRRRALLRDHRTLPVTDYGAGSHAGAARTRTVSQIARTAAKPARYGQLLFRLVNHFQPRHILELGTSLGLSTAYLAAPARQARVLTLEGDGATASVARETFAALGLANVTLLEGEFDSTLQPAVDQLGQQLDFVFFDGNHRYEPTLRYFRQCLPARTPESVFVLDDLYWSDEMRRAWETVKALPEVTLTVDLFFIGLVFFRPNAPRQHFTLRY